MINYAAATSSSRLRFARTIAVARCALPAFGVARRALPAFVDIVSRRLLNTGPEVNAAPAGPVHVVRIRDDADDSGSSVVQEEEGGNNPSHMVLLLPSSELLTPPIPENASSAAPVQQASRPMTSNSNPRPLVDDGQNSVRRESNASVARTHPDEHIPPPIKPCDHNKWWSIWDQLPMTDKEHLAFIVKASELLVVVTLTLSIGGFVATYNPKQDLGGIPNSVPETLPGVIPSSVPETLPRGITNSVPETLHGKICFTLVNFAMFLYAVYVCSMAKAAENNPIGLGTLPVHVLVIFSYLMLLGAFMTQYLTGAAIWKIALVELIVIAILLVKWAVTFNRPKILRRFLFCWGYFGTDPAAARTTEDEIIAQECNDSSSSAKTAFVAKLGAEKKAAIAKVIADEASEIQANAVHELAAARNRAEKASRWLLVAQLVNYVTPSRSVQWLQEVENDYEKEQKVAADAKERALKADGDAHKKMEEYEAANEEAKSAATIAQAKLERAEAAKKFWELAG